MKSYADLYVESPRAFLRKLEEDLKALEARLNRLDKLTATGIGNLLGEYERLALMVEQRAYGIAFVEQWSWAPTGGSPKVDNLYAAEEREPGDWFCWTGPEAATLFALPLQRTRTLQVRVRYLPGPGSSAGNVRVLADGDSLAIRATADGVICTLAPRVSQSARPTVVSIVSETVLPGGGDERRLGIGLQAIDITPGEDNRA